MVIPLGGESQFARPMTGCDNDPVRKFQDPLEWGGGPVGAYDIRPYKNPINDPHAHKSASCAGSPLHDGDFVGGQAVEFVHLGVDLAVQGGDLLLPEGPVMLAGLTAFGVGFQL